MTAAVVPTTTKDSQLGKASKTFLNPTQCLLTTFLFHRYETKSFNESSTGTPLNQDFSKMTLTSNDGGGNLSLIDSGGSTRLASMTQRVMERQTVTTSSETRSEKKSQQHSYRLS